MGGFAGAWVGDNNDGRKLGLQGSGQRSSRLDGHGPAIFEARHLSCNPSRCHSTYITCYVYIGGGGGGGGGEKKKKRREKEREGEKERERERERERENGVRKLCQTWQG